MFRQDVLTGGLLITLGIIVVSMSIVFIYHAIENAKAAKLLEELDNEN